MSPQIKVLCVDDDRATAQAVAWVLRLAGCEARACHDGQAALSLAAEFSPDVCLIDLHMPGMAGDELAAQLRRQAGGRPARYIALTGHWGIDARRRTHDAGFEQHLLKPLGPDALVEAVLGPGPAGAG